MKISLHAGSVLVSISRPGRGEERRTLVWCIAGAGCAARAAPTQTETGTGTGHTRTDDDDDAVHAQHARMLLTAHCNVTTE